MAVRVIWRDELVLTFQCRDEPGYVQDLMMDFDVSVLSVLTVPLNLGHVLQLNGVEAVVTSIVHFLPTKDVPDEITGVAVWAEVMGGPTTKEELIDHCALVVGLSNPRTESAVYVKES